jgi:hypothetical protein
MSSDMPSSIACVLERDVWAVRRTLVHRDRAALLQAQTIDSLSSSTASAHCRLTPSSLNYRASVATTSTQSRPSPLVGVVNDVGLFPRSTVQTSPCTWPARGSNQPA